MKSRDYWLQRFLQEKALQIHSQQTYQKQMDKRLNQLLDIYDKEIKYWYKRYSADLNIPLKDTIKILDGIEYKHFELTLEEFKNKAIKGGYKDELDSIYFKSRVARLNQLESQLKREAENLFSVERFKFEDELIKEYQSTYLHDTYNIQSYRGVFDKNFSTLNTDKLKHLLSNPWAKDDGKKRNFSERIWGNYVEELPSQLMDSMLRNTLTGANYNKIQKDFRERFVGVKTKHIYRLVITEMGHVQEEATAAAYKEQQVEKYQYLSTFERRTCDICGNLDSQVFKMSERVPGKNYPLIHPRCRCTTIPYLEDELPQPAKQWANGGTAEGLTFEQWNAAN